MARIQGQTSVKSASPHPPRDQNQGQKLRRMQKNLNNQDSVLTQYSKIPNQRRNQSHGEQHIRTSNQDRFLLCLAKLYWSLKQKQKRVPFFTSFTYTCIDFLMALFLQNIVEKILNLASRILKFTTLGSQCNFTFLHLMGANPAISFSISTSGGI